MQRVSVNQGLCGLAGTPRGACHRHRKDISSAIIHFSLAQGPFHGHLSSKRSSSPSPQSFLPQIHLWFAVSILWLQPLRAGMVTLLQRVQMLLLPAPAH